ncbi:MAG TPA: hypothetical protein VEA99_12595 [Gemmatimonadaceae bacterium]|nr:hypothetical protein [Gemmatimonadaceae bacterium]
MNRRRAVVALLTALASGCATRRVAPEPFTFPPDDGGPALMALEPRVVAETSGGRVRAVVPFRYRNRGPGVAAVSEGCGPGEPRLERWDGARWTRVYAYAELACLGPPLLVPAGAVFRDSIVVDAARGGPRQAPPLPRGVFHGPVAGRYRLVWGIHDAVNLEPGTSGPHNVGPPRAESERRSNEFEIVAGTSAPE